jgi:integrating conjugative element membrane protein (TIGR03747 family)
MLGGIVSVSSDTSQTRHLDRERQVKKKQSLTLDLIGIAADVFWLLVVALLFSIVAEWIGMSFIWSEEGVMHSERMLRTELGYINHDFRSAILGSTPMEYAIRSAELIDYCFFEWTHFRDVLAWGMSPDPEDGTIQQYFSTFIVLTSNYIEAAFNITQLYGVRLAIAILSMPAFILIGIAALVDGLAHRDLRRWTGADESSFVYHKVKPYVKPAFIGAWFIYLGMPVALHPNMIFIPASVLFGLTIFITSAMFKKSL